MKKIIVLLGLAFIFNGCANYFVKGDIPLYTEGPHFTIEGNPAAGKVCSQTYFKDGLLFFMKAYESAHKYKDEWYPGSAEASIYDPESGLLVKIPLSNTPIYTDRNYCGVNFNSYTNAYNVSFFVASNDNAKKVMNDFINNPIANFGKMKREISLLSSSTSSENFGIITDTVFLKKLTSVLPLELTTMKTGYLSPSGNQMFRDDVREFKITGSLEDFIKKFKTLRDTSVQSKLQ